MKEFVEKLIGRLEEQAEEHRKYWKEFGDEDSFGGLNAIMKAMSIVNQLAEEYGKDTNVTTNNGWIPCSERLPEKGGAYLVCSEKQSVYVAHFYKNSVVPHWSKGNIIYWQPLPAPFKKGE